LFKNSQPLLNIVSKPQVVISFDSFIRPAYCTQAESDIFY